MLGMMKRDEGQRLELEREEKLVRRKMDSLWVAAGAER